jgi:hypothetical protein
MGYEEPSPKKTPPPRSGGGRCGAKSAFESAKDMLKNNFYNFFTKMIRFCILSSVRIVLSHTS